MLACELEIQVRGQARGGEGVAGQLGSPKAIGVRLARRGDAGQELQQSPRLEGGGAARLLQPLQGSARLGQVFRARGRHCLQLQRAHVRAAALGRIGNQRRDGGIAGRRGIECTGGLQPVAVGQEEPRPRARREAPVDEAGQRLRGDTWSGRGREVVEHRGPVRLQEARRRRPEGGERRERGLRFGRPAGGDQGPDPQRRGARDPGASQQIDRGDAVAPDEGGAAGKLGCARTAAGVAGRQDRRRITGGAGGVTSRQRAHRRRELRALPEGRVVDLGDRAAEDGPGAHTVAAAGQTLPPQH